MARICDLPDDVLRLIFLELYNARYFAWDPSIFEAMRINRSFREVPFAFCLREMGLGNTPRGFFTMKTLLEQL